MPPEMKQKESLSAFKKTIKAWNPHNYPCRLCRKYAGGIGFIFDYDFLGLFNMSSETPYIEGSSDIETSSLICNVNRVLP